MNTTTIMNTTTDFLKKVLKLGFFALLSAFVVSLSCCMSKTGAAGDNDSIPEDTAMVDTIATTLVAYSDSTDFESVNIELSLPEDTAENAAILKSLWVHFDEVASRSYSDDSRIMPKYSGDWSNPQDIVDYYGKAIAESIGSESQKEYDFKVSEAKKHPNDHL